MYHPLNLEKRLEIRKKENSFRILNSASGLIDFASNDYLGFARNREVGQLALSILKDNGLAGRNGATGSRLLTGNHDLYSITEDYIKDFHNCEAALIYNSGYDANIGFFGTVPQRGDLILFDELVHASIREGIRLSNARSFKFRHNDLKNLEDLIIQNKTKTNTLNDDLNIFIVTESIFSMDGNCAPVREIAGLAESYNAFLIFDEAHATGIFGHKGQGLVQQLDAEKKVFARIITFGKALGCHGAAVLGSKFLKDYLINFSRSFIYTTALPPHSVATILAAYQLLDKFQPHRELAALNKNIEIFRTELESRDISSKFIESESAIQCCIINGNDGVKMVAAALQEKGFDVKPILSPTVPQGKERIRICLHSFNSPEDIKQLVEELANLIK